MSEKKRLFVLHTLPNFMEVNHRPYGIPVIESHPEIEIENMLDTSLLSETIAAGRVTPSVSSRILAYVQGAERAGADMLLLTCTSVDAGMKHVKEFSSLPTLCISEPMVRQALDLGTRIGIVGTVATSPASIIAPLRTTAATQGIDPDSLTIPVEVAGGALEARVSGDNETHDRLVSTALMKLADEHEVDAICFAQASMSAARHEDPGVPVLKLGASAYAAAAEMLTGG